VARGELEVRTDRAEDRAEIGRLLGDKCVGALALLIRVGLAQVPSLARQADKLTAVVVLPTPPF
jgi:hypothetical protein